MRFQTLVTRVLSPALLIVTISGCAYIIPPEQNAPRNNEVRGDRKRPQMNTMSPQSAVTPRERAPVIAPGSTAAAAGNSGERRVPVENQAFQLAANDYPSLNAVPPRPVMTGPDSAKERLSETKSTLEYDRAVATERKETLARDAAAEPSMLSDLPKTDGVVPAADPVRAMPLAPLPPASMPTPTMQPATKPTSAVTPSFSPMDEGTTAGLQPITLKAPTISVPVEVAMPYTAPDKPLRPGEFDPLAVADNAPLAVAPSPAVSAAANRSYVSTSYLPPSRYYNNR